MGSTYKKSEPSEIWRRNLASFSGMSRNGLPLSANRAASDDLSPWVARLVSAKATNSTNSTIACGMCNDLAYVRNIFNGRWTALTVDAHQTHEDEVLLFGQHSKYMPLTCTGDIMSAGFGMRAGAFYALTGIPATEMLDRVVSRDLFGLRQSEFREVLCEDYAPEQWNLAIEECLRRYIDKHDPPPPDPISVAFELAAFEDPTQPLGDFAEAHNINLRMLQRIVKRDFGISPRMVMRRARALDLASQLCGVANEDEAEEMMLRFFDQAHQIREFQSFFGVSPQKFRAVPRPLLTISLEQRQARRLEELERHQPGTAHSWRTDSDSDDDRPKLGEA